MRSHIADVGAPDARHHRPARTRAAARAARRSRIAPEWKDQQRLWGHPFHPMCSYLASFPAALAHAFIARYSRPGDVVLDPFSGRGTTPLQACAEGRIGVGNDLNPFAHLLTAAKVEPATRAQAATRLAALRLAWNAGSAGWLALGERVLADPPATPRSCRSPAPAPAPTSGVEPVPLEVALAFHPRTLGQLLFVRTRAPPRRPDGPLPRRRPDRHPPRQERRRTSRSSCPTRSAWRRATSATSPRGPPSRRRSATSSTAWQEARPALPPAAPAVGRGIALLGDARDVGAPGAGGARARGRPSGPGSW